MHEFDLIYIDGRLALDLKNLNDNLELMAYTGAPEYLPMSGPAPIVGTVRLSDEQYAKIVAEYENGGECAWCGEIASELRKPHIYDRAPNGGRMCRSCWDHDREMYKGAYGDDIGPFSGEEAKSQ